MFLPYHQFVIQIFSYNTEIHFGIAVVRLAPLLSKTDKVESRQQSVVKQGEVERMREGDLPSGCFLSSASGEMGQSEGLPW